jgi:hypothetical protein
MLKLPKIEKVVGTGVAGIKKIKNVVLAAAVGVTLSVAATNTSAALPSESAAKSLSQVQRQSGALLLVPGADAATKQFAAHYSHVSHSSHSSHSSHQSHHSHYSSRY